MPASMLLAALLFAAPKDLSFAPLLEEGAEWTYTLYSEGEDGMRTDLPAPGELHLKVALVRQVGKATLVALVLMIDGVDGDQLRSDLNLDGSPSTSPYVLAIDKNGLHSVGLELGDARTATEAQVTAALTTGAEPLVFPAKARAGAPVHWKLDDTQQTGSAKATLTRAKETVDGRELDTWSTHWKGKACFAGECTPFAGTQSYAPEAGLVRLCRIATYGQSTLSCLRLVGRAKQSIPAPVEGQPPHLGAIWRMMQSVKPAILACMGSASSVSELGFHIEPDGSLSAVKELNQSGPAAACIVKAAAGVHFPPFEGQPVVVERISFAH